MPIDEVATVIVLPTLWSGPWIWREQAATLDAVCSQRVFVEEAVANWPVEPRLEALDAHVLAGIGTAASPWLLVGGSLGGLLALRLAAQQPGRVAGVVASGCPGLGPGGELGVRLTSPPAPQEARRIRERIFVDPACLADAEILSAAAQVSGRDAARRAVRLLRVLDGYDPAPMLLGLQVPTALVWGRCDQLTPGAPWRAIARNHPHLRFAEVPDTGHVPMLEAPARFQAALAALWEDEAAAEPRSADGSRGSRQDERAHVA